MAKLIMDSYRPDVSTYSRFSLQFLRPKERKKYEQNKKENKFIK